MKHDDEKLKLGAVGDVIKSFRLQKNLTLQELTDVIGWSNRSRLSRYENNEIALSTRAIEDIARGLGMPSLVLLIECLMKIYPELSDSSGRPSELLAELLDEAQAD